MTPTTQSLTTATNAPMNLEQSSGPLQELVAALHDRMAVPLLRRLFQNGWYTPTTLATEFAISVNDLDSVLGPLVKLGLIERRPPTPASGPAIAYRLNRSSEYAPLLELLRRDCYVKDVGRFYLLLLHQLLERSESVDRGLGVRLLAELQRSLREQSGRPRRLLDLALHRPSSVAVAAFTDEVDQGLVDDHDIALVKETYVGAISTVIATLEGSLEPNVAKLVVRLASRPLLSDPPAVLSTFGLLEPLPSLYFRQVG